MQSIPVFANYTSALILQVTRELLKQNVSHEIILTVVDTMTTIMEENDRVASEYAKQDRQTTEAFHRWLQPGNLG